MDLDTHPFSNLIRPLCAERVKPGRGKPVQLAFSFIFAAIIRMRTAKMGWATQRGPRPGTYIYLSHASCVIVSWLRAAMDLDTHPFSNLIRPLCAERVNEVSQCLLCNWLFRLFSRHSAKSPHYSSCSTKLLLSLISRLVACSAVYFFEYR